jgi:cytochrome c553
VVESELNSAEAKQSGAVVKRKDSSSTSAERTMSKKPGGTVQKVALSLPILVVLLAASAASPADTDQTGAQIVAQGTKKGVIACARCHGFDGAADGSGAFPRITGQSADYLADQLRAYASGYRKNAIMQPIAIGLDDAEIKAVAQYYATAHAMPFIPPPQPAQLIARGKEIAKSGDANAHVDACETCHGSNGEGIPPIPYLAGQYSQYMKLQFRMYREGFRKTDVMGDPAKNLKESDVAAVAVYFEQVSRATPK